MQQLRRQSVGNIHHRRRHNPGLGQVFDNVAACFRFQLALDKVFLALKLWHEILLPRRCHLFTFQQLQSHICRAEVARYTNQIGVMGTRTIYNPILRGITDTRD